MMLLNCFVLSFITCNIYYCNALITGCTSALIDKLRKIQGKAARLVTHTKVRRYITPVLRGFHWIDFKILRTAFKCLEDSAPTYLNVLIYRY